MADTVNQRIADRLTARQLQVGRVESSLRRQVWDQLRLLEDEILSAMKSNDPTDFALLARRRLEVQRLMANEIDPLVTARYQHIADLLDAALLRLARNEVEVVQQVVNEETEEETVAGLPSERQLRAGVVHGLFPSAAKPTDLSTTGQDWWQRQGAGLVQRLGDSLTVGVSLEESLTQLTQRVRGTSEAAFTDGVMAKARDDAARLVRTQTTNAVSEARVSVAERNAARVYAVQHSSILDSRVSYICAARHGLRYRLPDHEPIGHSVAFLSGIPYHIN